MTRKCRSKHWDNKFDKDGFMHRAWMKNQGFPDEVFDGRPIIGIGNTWGELSPCNLRLCVLAEAGGTLASNTTLQLLVSDDELKKRRTNWKPTQTHYARGYATHINHIVGAAEGVDLDFLIGKDTRLVARESH